MRKIARDQAVVAVFDEGSGFPPERRLLVVISGRDGCGPRAMRDDQEPAA